MSNIAVIRAAREPSRLALVPSSVLLGSLTILVIACAIALLISLTQGYGILQSLTFLVVITFFMAAWLPLFVSGYYDNVCLILFMISVNSVYCLALVLLKVENVFIYCMPQMVLLTIFVFRFHGNLRLNLFIAFILFFLIVPSLAGSIGSQLVEFDKIITYMFLSFFMPLVVFAAINAKLDVDQVENIMCISFLLMVALSMILIPVEILSRGSGSVSSMEVGGRSYTVLAILILIFPVLRDWWSKQSRLVFWFSVSLVILTIIFSFSRGVFLFTILSTLPFILIKILSRPTILFRFIVIGCVLTYLISLVKDFNLVNEIFWFWSVRLNIFDNVTEQYSFEISKIFDSSGRMYIWDNAVRWIAENFIFGTGVGSSPELIVPSTGTRLGFGGMHNQSLTVFVERGVFGFLALIGLWVFYGWQVSRLSLTQGKLIYSYCFLLYLAFVHSTGIELLVISTKDLNSSALLYLLMMISIVSLRFREAR